MCFLPCFVVTQVFVLDNLQGRHERRHAVARLLIIVVQRLVVVQFIAHDTQHVVVKPAAVTAFDRQRLVSSSLHGGQSFTGLGIERHRKLVILLQLTVVLIYLLQHHSIDGSQCLVSSLAITLLHSLDSGLQRVGGDGGHHPTARQFGSHQLAVLSFALGLVHYLHQHVVLRAGQVFLLCLFCLFPQRRICLSLYRHTQKCQ